MAKNREPEKPVQSESESGEEEDDDDATTEEGSHESDSEPEQTQVATKPSSSTPAIVKKIQPMSASRPPQQRDSSSSDEEDSGSETESDSDVPDGNVRPIVSKPMDVPQKSNAGGGKPRSKAGASVPVTPVKTTAAKRPAEEKETEGKDAKKAKKKPEPENSEKKATDDSKRTLFQRLWSEDDEIVVLKGMIDYAAKKKSDPLVDLSAFHDFIKKNLHVDVTKTQLQDKIRRLKKKYENNKKKEKEGKARNFTNPHELKAYELSKKYWGSENGKESVAEKVVGSPKANGSVARKTPKKKDNVVDNEEVKDVKGMDVIAVGGENVLPSKRLNSHSRSAGVEETILLFGTELFGGGNGSEEEKEWKRLMLEEMEVYQKQLELRSKQTKLVVDALRSRGL